MQSAARGDSDGTKLLSYHSHWFVTVFGYYIDLLHTSSYGGSLTA